MKRLFFSLLLLFIYNEISPSMRKNYKITTKEVLSERFKELHLTHFYMHTHLENLAQQWITPVECLSIIHDMIKEYKQYLWITNSSEIEKFISCITRQILKDYPRILQRLTSDGFIQNLRSDYNPTLIVNPIKTEYREFFTTTL